MKSRENADAVFDSIGTERSTAQNFGIKVPLLILSASFALIRALSADVYNGLHRSDIIFRFHASLQYPSRLVRSTADALYQGARSGFVFED